MSPPDRRSRIASLLPSATEICFELGLGERVVGVSHECDFPTPAQTRPALTAAKIASAATSGEIDRQVRALASDGLSIYRILEDRLKEVRPDLILTQDVCELCAVSLDDVREATSRLLGNEVEIVSLSPSTVDDVLDDVARVGRAAHCTARAQGVIAALRRRLEALRAETEALRKPRVLMVEWMDPPMIAGHWTPELIRAAGGEPVLAHDGEPTRATTWEAVLTSEPEVVLVAPCGFSVAQSAREMPALIEVAGFAETPAAKNNRIFVTDGNHYFNRPGPRIVESAEVAAALIHPTAFADRFGIDSSRVTQWSGRP